MSDSTPQQTLPLSNYDAVTLQLSRAMATLACISAAIDPDNPNTASAALTIIAIDGVIGMIEMSLRLMKQTPAAIVQLHPPPANQP